MKKENTGQGQIIEAQSIQQNKDGSWSEVIPEKYLGLKRVWCFFGWHTWRYTLQVNENGDCVLKKETPSRARCRWCGIKFNNR